MSQDERLSVAVGPRTGELVFSDDPESGWQDCWRDGHDEGDKGEKEEQGDGVGVEKEPDTEDVPILPYFSPTSPMFANTDATGAGALIADDDDSSQIEYECIEDLPRRPHQATNVRQLVPDHLYSTFTAKRHTIKAGGWGTTRSFGFARPSVHHT
jgi:hypothetical protein